MLGYRTEHYGLIHPSLHAQSNNCYDLGLTHAPADLANGLFRYSTPTMCSTNGRCDCVF